jgi:putative flavoprotein involved in K+ transport
LRGLPKVHDWLVKSRLTQRAPNWWKSPRFQAICWAWNWFRQHGVASSRPPNEAAAHVQFADNFSQRLKYDVDAYLLRAGIMPPPLEYDRADVPDLQAEYVSSLRQLNYREANISTVIWATGFTADFSWIHLPVLSTEDRPIYQSGISPVHGLYFIGFPWLKSRKSGIIYGISEDAHYIADAIS